MIEISYKTVLPVICIGLYHFFDVQYLWKCLMLVFSMKRNLFRPVKDSLVTKGQVGLRDLDIFFHMNNSRYLWNMDFSRITFFYENGIFQTMKKLAKQAILTVGASTIRYRRSLQYLEKYEVITRLVYFDDKNFYVEQKFVSSKDNFISAIAYVKVTIRKVTPIEILKVLTNLSEEELQMDCPDYIRSWIEFNDNSSKSLKPIKTD